MSSATADVLGEIGLPVPIRELAAKAYLARAGQRVLVVESRARVGGACTIEEPFPGVRLSPCAYLAGLLHPLVLEEFELPRRGYVWTPAVNGLFVPFLDGSSIQLWVTTSFARRRCAPSLLAMLNAFGRCAT
jgi:phytoene dehydrogenase-like protein